MNTELKQFIKKSNDDFKKTETILSKIGMHVCSNGNNKGIFMNESNPTYVCKLDNSLRLQDLTEYQIKVFSFYVGLGNELHFSFNKAINN